MRMRGRLMTCLACLLLPLGATNTTNARDAASTTPIPQIIRAGQTEPIFVSATLLEEARSLRKEGKKSEFEGDFGPALEFVQRMKASLAPGALCIDPWSSAESEVGLPNRRDLKTALAHADHVLIVRVTETLPGLMSSQIPGTLLRIETTRLLHGFEPAADLVFFPVGTFEIGDFTICKTHANYAKLPEVGEQMLLVLNDHWLNDSGILFLYGSTGAVTLTRSGHASLPKAYERDDKQLDALGMENFLEAVEMTLRTQAEGTRQ